ncbi:DNA translocase FtsK, partial [Methylobacterium sp. J-048]|uniref:DNA translocase FtsK n=1 Tax=Methylobacterium sp. J-048 TaxID=2836635 RepID=UPI0024440B2B
MRASGRPPYSHRDPARPVRGGDRSGLSLGALAHRLKALRASLTRRLSGSPAGLPARPGYAIPGRRTEPSWLTAPAALVGRDGFERGPRASASAPPDHAWPAQVFDDRASLDALDEPRFESRIDRGASTPGVLVRQPRRPASIAPEDSVPASPVQAAAAPAARWTRTPDSVLQERRQRALEAERVALERARAEAHAAAMAVETERAAREQEARHQEARERAEREQAEQARLEAAAMPESAQTEIAEDGTVVPLWRQPFVAPPGVRYFRTPDRRPVRPSVELSASTAAIARVAVPEAVIAEIPAEASAEGPVEAPARDWSDLPDWSEAQPWFDGSDWNVGDWSSVEAWAALATQPAHAGLEAALAAAPVIEAAEHGAPPMHAGATAQPPRPVYVLDRLVRFDQPPRPADGQDNGRDDGLHADDTAAIRDAFLPAKPALALVFGPGSAATEPAAPAMAAAEASRRAPALCAMAARAAIRAAGQPSVPAPVLPAASVPMPEAAAPIGTDPVRSAPEADRAVIPMTQRTVLLRGKMAPQPEPAPAEPEPAQDEPAFLAPAFEAAPAPEPVEAPAAPVAPALPMVAPRAHLIPAGRHLEIASVENADYELPSLGLLALPDENSTEEVDADVLEQNALNLQQTVQDFGVRGDILAVRPGPVVT